MASLLLGASRVPTMTLSSLEGTCMKENCSPTIPASPGGSPMPLQTVSIQCYSVVLQMVLCCRGQSRDNLLGLKGHTQGLVFLRTSCPCPHTDNPQAGFTPWVVRLGCWTSHITFPSSTYTHYPWVPHSPSHLGAQNLAPVSGICSIPSQASSAFIISHNFYKVLPRHVHTEV